MASDQMNGSQILLQALKDQGVDTVFGYPGGAVLPIYDEMFEKDYFRHILVRHEPGAVHAAEGYARSTGKPGVVLVTSGPGATNTVTGLTDALMDSIPVVCICGQVPTHLIGNDAFQEADTTGITRSCTKHNYLVKDVADLARVIHEAFLVATNGRPGPVLVDLPKDVALAMGDYTPPSLIKHKSYKPQLKGDIDQIKRAVEIIASAKKPLFYCGGGVINSGPAASQLLTEFVRLTGFPCTLTLMGLGAFPASDSQFLGMVGMHGTYEANLAMHDCDVMINVGARFDDRVTGLLSEFSPNSTKIHIDIDLSSINKNVRVDVGIVGDAGHVLEDMLKVWKSSQAKVDEDSLKDWWKEIDDWRKRDCLRYKQGDELIKPQYAIQRLYEYPGDVNHRPIPPAGEGVHHQQPVHGHGAPVAGAAAREPLFGNLHELTKSRDQVFISTEVGQHQMWAAQFFQFEKPNHWLTSGGLGTMGYGLPAALGAQISHPDALVIDIAGEASILMNIQEMSTIAQYRLPVKVFIINNQYMGMVRQWQSASCCTRAAIRKPTWNRFPISRSWPNLFSAPWA